jgi:hypothetical protein
LYRSLFRAVDFQATLSDSLEAIAASVSTEPFRSHLDRLILPFDAALSDLELQTFSGMQAHHDLKSVS